MTMLNWLPTTLVPWNHLLVSRTTKSLEKIEKNKFLQKIVQMTHFTEAYLTLCQTCDGEFYVKIVNGF